jgi:hypothetical protein
MADPVVEMMSTLTIGMTVSKPVAELSVFEQQDIKGRRIS